MATDLLIHATGLCALACNTLALLRTCERSLRLHSGVAGVIWALNNILLIIDVRTPDVDLSHIRSLPAVAGLLVMIFGLIWEKR